MQVIGVFASRTPHRPSPLGLTLARLDRIEGGTLHLSGVDLVNGTPVLDVKPYIPACDRPLRARTGWVERCPAPRNPRDGSQMREGKELLFFVLEYDVFFHIRAGESVVGRIAPADDANHSRPPLPPGLLENRRRQ